MLYEVITFSVSRRRISRIAVTVAVCRASATTSVEEAAQGVITSYSIHYTKLYERVNAMTTVVKSLLIFLISMESPVDQPGKIRYFFSIPSFRGRNNGKAIDFPFVWN